MPMQGSHVMGSSKARHRGTVGHRLVQRVQSASGPPQPILPAMSSRDHVSMSQPRNGARRVRFDGRRVSVAVSRWLRAAVSLAAAAAAVGCESHPTATMDDGIRVEVFLSQTDLVLPQDSLAVRVVATNTTRWPRAIETVACNTNFRLWDDAGNVVPHAPNACIFVRSTVSLAPGEQVEFTRVWRGQLYTSGGATVRATPGTYRLVGFVNSRLTSEPATIRIHTAE